MKWEVKPWRDIVEIKSGRNQKDVKNSDGKYPIYGSGGIMGYADNFICDEGTTIIGRKGTINKPIFVEEKFWNVDTAFGLIPSKIIDHRFLFYFCLGYDFTKHDKGTTLPSLVKKDLLANVFMPVPPIAEQKRIVEILDESFAGIERAEAIARQNLTNARELFDSYLNNIFIEENADWNRKPLKDVCEKITVGHVGSMKSRYKETGIPFLRSQNICPFKINLNNIVYIDEKFNEELKKSQLRPGDVAVVRTGYPGTAAVIPEELEISNCSDLVIVKPSDNISPDFLCLFFNSEVGKKLVAGNLVGAAQKHFNVTAAKQVIFPFPSIQKQQKIVHEIWDMSNKIQQLEAIYQRKIEALGELKQSILQKAFTGQLTQ